MTLIIQKPTGSKLTLRQAWQPMDPDAAAYITAVETADGQALEEKVKIAIDNFVLGCKADGIWSAIKASCILAGARTLAGALIPLAGSAPSKQGTEAGWNYSRETGLKGNGSNNYLDSNRAGSADPQDNAHVSVYVTSDTAKTSGFPGYFGNVASVNGATNASRTNGALTNTVNVVLQTGSVTSITRSTLFGLLGAARSESTSFKARANGIEEILAAPSQPPNATNLAIFRAINNVTTYTDARLAFYSIGESLDLALLDARVTDLINAIGVAIP